VTTRLLTGTDRTIPTFLRTKAERNGDRAAIRFGDESVSYEQLHADAARLAGGLLELGVRPGENVAILMGNSIDFPRVWFGINLAGAVEVPVNTEYRRDGLSYILNHSEARILIVDAVLLPRVIEVSSGLEHLETVLVRGDSDPAPELDTRPLDTVLESSSPDVAALPRVRPGDLAAIMYTSGTTGPPKGVMLPHGSPIAWAEETIGHFALRPGETHYCCFPMFHTLAQYFATMPALGNDGTLALGQRFSVSRFWSDIRRYGAASANMMGSTVPLLFGADPRPDDADNPLRIAFGAPAPPALMPDFERRFGLQFVEIYGSSESNVVIWNPLDDNRHGTCGRLGESFDVRLVDEDDLDVPDGEPGEIVTRPHEPYSMTLGYFRNPEATVAAFRNCWFHTGDLGRRDADGYYSFVDRMKDSIRRRGENISSWEVETVISRWPAVAESAAFGVPSELSEEEVMVVVVPRGVNEIDLAELAEFCAANMPRYMVPRYWEVAEDLPRTQTGKVEKYRLRERGHGASTWDREASTVTR
jgi:crotonobetaine/carnitine-CoA ligase